MKYTVEKQEKYTLFRLEEDKLNTLNAPALKTEFVTLFQGGTENLILDLSKVRYVDSSGLSAILVAKRLCSDVNGLMILVGINAMITKLLQISKLENIVYALPTVQEAIDAIFLHEIEKDLSEELDESEEE